MTEIPELIAEAEKLTQDTEPSLRPIAFRVVLEKLLSGSSSSIPCVASLSSVAGTTGVARLAQECKVPLDKIAYLFHIDEANHSIRILHSMEGSEVKKQVAAALLYLTAKKYIFGEDSASSTELNEMMVLLGISSLSNLALNLKRESADFILNTSTGKPVYTLTTPGTDKGKVLIRQLISVDENAKG